jgi:hypothetical protein
MTAEPIRDLGFASWIDPDAWMESMEGPRWKQTIAEENNRVNDFIKKHNIPKLKDRFKTLIHSVPNQEFSYRAGSIEIKKLNAFFLEWRWLTQPKKTFEARDIWADSTHAWATQDTGSGSETFTLSCFSENRKLPLWKKTPVGPDLAVKGEYIVYLGVVNKLWYNEVWVADKKTGGTPQLIYKELNPECNLSIVRQEGGKIFIVRDHAQEKEYFEVFVLPRPQLKPMTDSDAYMPSTLAGLRVPHGVNWYEPTYNLCSTRSHGKQTLWQIKPLKQLLTIPLGSIEIDPWAVHESAETCILTVQTPTDGNQRFIIHKSKPNQTLEPLDFHQQYHSSDYQVKRYKSATAYYAVLTKRGTHPKKGLIIGYGAYGLPTSSSYAGARWNPLLQNGWAIVYTFIRGGGDHTEAWAKAGRCSGRSLTIQDFLNCVHSFKTIYSILAKNIVLYGRSAGGILVGNSLAKVPNGALFGGIFAEVPYVDVLRTTTNPTLPLTRMEYKEFGNPAESIQDFISVAKMSPADLAVGLKTPKLFVFCRTAENDSEVYTYEPVKWIRRLREASPSGMPKLLKITLGAGHFTNPGETQDAYAEDCAILEALTR